MINFDKIWFKKEEPEDKKVVWFTDGQIRIFNNGTWQSFGSSAELADKVDSLDKEVGDILNQIGSSGGITELEFGDTPEILARNLAKLNKVSREDSFLVDIDYGFGTGSWNAGAGGKAFITKSTGIHVNYTIGKDGKLTKGLEIDTSKLNSDLFVIVSELPEASKADRSKIYCVKSTASSVQTLEARHAVTLESKDNTPIVQSVSQYNDNKNIAVQAETAQGTINRYVEYIVIQENVDGKLVYDWEKVGEFKADPDLSGYAKLSGAKFSGDTIFSNGCRMSALYPFNNNRWIICGNQGEQSPNKTFSTNGKIANLGPSESFIFTLEDGTKVTKNIRVLSTTNS